MMFCSQCLMVQLLFSMLLSSIDIFAVQKKMPEKIQQKTSSLLVCTNRILKALNDPGDMMKKQLEADKMRLNWKKYKSRANVLRRFQVRKTFEANIKTRYRKILAEIERLKIDCEKFVCPSLCSFVVCAFKFSSRFSLFVLMLFLSSSGRSEGVQRHGAQVAGERN